MGKIIVIRILQALLAFLTFATPMIQFSCVNAQTNETFYHANKCDSHPSCNAVCGNFPGLAPRCDRRGICVCDCTNMETINSNPVPELCSNHIPSHDHDSCIKYAQITYNREQARICGKLEVYLYCTALCKWY